MLHEVASNRENTAEQLSLGLLLKIRQEINNAETSFYYIGEFYRFAVERWFSKNLMAKFTIQASAFEYMREKEFRFFVALRNLNSDPSRYNKLTACEEVHSLLFYS